MTPRRMKAGEETAVLRMIRDAFAPMEGRIDPPSSMHRLTGEAIATQNESGEVWVIGNPVQACVFLTPHPDHLYLGKLAVAQQGAGLAHRLMRHAEQRARALGRDTLRLECRVELTGNHAYFHRQGFVQTGTSSHSGFDRPTSLTFTKQIGGLAPTDPMPL